MSKIPLIALSTLLMAALGCTDPATTLARRDQTFADLMEKGNHHFRRGEYEEAADRFRGAQRVMPDSALAANMRGMAMLRLKKRDQAMASFQKAIELNPSFAPAYCNLGAVHAAEQRLPQAREALLKAVELSPNLASAHLSLGSLCVVLGRVEEGRQHLAKAFELEPTFRTEPPRSSVGVGGRGQITRDACVAFARIYAEAGRSEDVVFYLKEAQRLGFSDWNTLLSEPSFARVRAQKEFAGLLK